MKKLNLEKKHLLWLIITGVFICMLFLNFLTSFIADDFPYSGSTSILDALEKEAIQYMNVNGRSVVHFLLRNFLMFPKPVFNIMNAAAFTLLTGLIYLYANKGKSLKISLYLFIVSALWLYIGNFGQTVLWETGSCNYLWGTLIILTFLFFYHRSAVDGFQFKHKILPTAAMLLLGVLAGWCNENTSGGCILAAIMLMFWIKIKKSKLHLWMFTGLAGAIAGLTAMILSPGNSMRSERFANDRSFIVSKLDSFSQCTNYITKNLIPLLILFIVFIAAGIAIRRQWKPYFIPIMFGAVSIITVYALIIPPVVATRAMFGATVFLIIGCAHGFADLLDQPSSERGAAVISRFIPCSVAAFVTLNAALMFIPAAYDTALTGLNLEERNRLIAAQMNNGNENIIVPYINNKPKTQYNPMFGLEDIKNDPTHWANRHYLLKYKMDTIRAVSVDVWRAVYQNGDMSLMGCFDLNKYAQMVSDDTHILVASVVLPEDSDGGSLLEYLNRLGFSSDNDEASLVFTGIKAGSQAIIEKWHQSKSRCTSEQQDLAISVSARTDAAYSKIDIAETSLTLSGAGIHLVVLDKSTLNILDRAIIALNDENIITLTR